MLDEIFRGVFDADTASVIGVGDFLLCMGTALLLGALLALSDLRRGSSKSFLVTLAILPAVVCVVIMMVNGNVGAGVAVAGAFSLVRFRSAPGSAREISMLFLAMGAGLITGMGYLGYGILFTVLMGGVSMFYNRLAHGNASNGALCKTLTVTIPEDLNYSEIFADLMEEYTAQWELIRVKTTNMGSLFRLTYRLTLRDASREKEFLDAIRCRNGNLEISLAQQETVAEL